MRNGSRVPEADRIEERLAAVEEALDEIAADHVEFDVQLRQLRTDLDRVVAVLDGLHGVLQVFATERSKRP